MSSPLSLHNIISSSRLVFRCSCGQIRSGDQVSYDKDFTWSVLDYGEWFFSDVSVPRLPLCYRYCVMVSHYLPLEDVSGRVSRPSRVGVSANGAALERTDPPALHHLHWYPLYLAAILFPRHLPSELVFNRIAICMGSFVCLVSMLQGFDRAVNLPRLALTCSFICRIDRFYRVSQPRPLRSSRSVLFWRTLQFQAFQAPNVVFAHQISRPACSRHLPLPANQHHSDMANPKGPRFPQLLSSLSQ